MTLTFAGKQTLRSKRHFNISFPDNATNTINKNFIIYIYVVDQLRSFISCSLLSF